MIIKSFASCSSRINARIDTFEADVDNVDIDVVDLSSNDDVAALPYSDEDTEKLSIVNDHTSEGVDTLADEKKDLQAVRTKRTERHNNESAERIMLTQEAVFRFV